MTSSVDLGRVTASDAVQLPWSAGAPLVELRYHGLDREPVVRGFRLPQGRMDGWRQIPLGDPLTGVTISSDNPAVAAARLMQATQVLRSTVHGVVLPAGESVRLVGCTEHAGRTVIELACDLLGAGPRMDVMRLSSPDRLTWRLDAVVPDVLVAEALRAPALPCLPLRDGTLVCLIDSLASPPVRALRIWERKLSATAGVADVPLRFRVLPGTWPQITLGVAEGTNSDVSAAGHELRLNCEPGTQGSITVDIAGFVFSLTARTLAVRDAVLPVPGSGPIRVVLLLQGDHAALSVTGLPPLLLRADPSPTGGVAVAVTTNIENFALTSRAPSVGRISLTGDASLLDATLYGLREPTTSLYRATRARVEAGPLFYAGPTFSVHAHQVCERGAPPALVPDRSSIVTPLRVMEEFVWRENPYGDMTRVVDRGELWRSRVEPGRFPELHTSFPTVDASFELAAETYQRNSSEEFSLPGQAGLWSAGYFQGPGLGFGVWRRDTAHIALRSGNLVDPEVARASLAYTAREGFDNGSDGAALPAVAIWDHLLATGDTSLVYETWPQLTAAAAALDARFVPRRGLVVAPQATSNDCFDEPEADGFALSTEIYSMQTYAALSQLGGLPGIRDARVTTWRTRAATMRNAIVKQYWNPDHGFFTSGPRGSESWANGYWETSGAEAALWGFLGPEVEPLTAGILNRLREVAMSDYGIVLFPYKGPDNHFCNSVWYGWQVGVARAAARIGDSTLVHQLIGQQVRTVVRNKTFYEVTDATTGDSWRWPGQLWHAAGFVSLILFGLLGIRYDLRGMTFTPAVTAAFDGARVRHLRYRSATLDIEIRGRGSRCRVLLDGRPVTRIVPDTSGHHTVVLEMR